MKRCPECRRDYYDDTLSFCLDDGRPLIDGPRIHETATAILTRQDLPGEPPTRHRIETDAVTGSMSLRSTSDERSARGILQTKHWLIAGIIAVLLSVGLFSAYRYFLPEDKPSESVDVDVTKTTPRLYWQMTNAEQLAFLEQRARHIQTLIGDEPAEIDSDSLAAIKTEVDSFVDRKDSLSQKQFQEGLRVIYGRATQYAPLVIQAYEKRKVSPALGLYQAMIESEYRDCDPEQFGHGMFGFSRKTAAKYGVGPRDLCNVEKQLGAAADYMSDLASDFGGQKPNPTLGLLAYAEGEDNVHGMLRRLRAKGITEQSFWVILKHKTDVIVDLDDFAGRYVPRFFAAAIIGETPEAFGLTTPPLTTLRKIDI